MSEKLVRVSPPNFLGGRPMKKVLIVYATKEGQTKKIADVIAGELAEKDFAVYLSDASQILEQNHVESYDGVLVGASIHAGGYPKPVTKWLKTKANVLNRKPTAFFSVCLGILQKDEKVQREVHQFPQDLFKVTGWRPQLWTVLAGALPYTKYNWLTRFIMKRIVTKAGGDTDTSRDYEYTDWIEVKKFAGQFASMLDKSLEKNLRHYPNEDYEARFVPKIRNS
jgi:menaquinone-dependent protoporphyrinogen oxidase